jgi:hypothetical protein
LLKLAEGHAVDYRVAGEIGYERHDGEDLRGCVERAEEVSLDPLGAFGPGC